MPCFIPVLRRLGDSWEVPDDMMDVLENSRTTSVNELYNMKLTHFCDTAASTFETSKSLNFLNRSPCQRLPEQYITCVNYLHVVPIWKQDHNCWTRHFIVLQCTWLDNPGWDPGVILVWVMFCQEGWLTLRKKLDQMTILMRKVVRMLICLLCEMVIQINPVVEADESNHFVLANYCTDA